MRVPVKVIINGVVDSAAVFAVEAQIERGVPKAEAYTVTMYIMASLLVVGFFCNLAVTAVDPKHHVKES